MRHESDDIAVLICHCRNIPPRSVGIGIFCSVAGRIAITCDDSATLLERVERRVVSEVASFAIRDRQPEYLPHGSLIRPSGVSVFDLYVKPLALKRERLIS